jgi:small subunit ribosomal protein S3
MGQKTHPIGFRVGIYLPWESRWFARKGVGKTYADLLLEDEKIRRFINLHLRSALVSRIEIEKAGDGIKVTVYAGRPGVVIGKRGSEIEGLRKNLGKLIGRDNVEVSVQEVKQPELDATIVATDIALGIEKRGSYKKLMKKAALTALRLGAKGIKVSCAGRLAGAEIARTELVRYGSIPQHTLRSNIDYALVEALTTYGKIGIKVWIYKGDYKAG